MRRVLTSRNTAMKLAALIAAVLTLSLIVPAQAGIITVDAGGGGDHTTIAAAVAAAIDGDTIDILSNITEHSITVNKSLTFVGQGADVTTVQNTTATKRIFNLTANKNYVFQDFTLTGGDSSGAGGAINMEKWKITTGSVTIDRMAFVDNSAVTLGGAVGINDQSTTSNNKGTVTITNSTFENNSASPTSYGGGGAVYLGTIHTATVQNSTFSGNTSSNGGSWRAFGGALYINADGMTAPVGLVQNSTFVDNSMTGLSSAGGAIYGSDNVTVESCVFAGNSVAAGYDWTVSLDKGTAGTIINSLAEGDIINGGTLDGGGNTENLGAGNALVGALADNGGPTLTHALLTGSPAIDAGSNPAGLTYDQRGAGYARVVGSRADMGAYEIPEPATMAVLGLGSLAVLCRRRRR